MSTPLDLITDALIQIGAQAPGEDVPADKANAALRMANYMLDGWSNQHLLIFYQQEVILEITGGVRIYTFGSPAAVTSLTTNVGCQFNGIISGLNNEVLTVNTIQSGMINIGQNLTVSSTDTTIVGFTQARGADSSPQGLGSYLIDPPVPFFSGSMVSYNPRPLRINSAFVRVATLDYPVKILSYEDYEKIGLKSLAGPWPYGLYYQPTFPIANLYFWPNPSAGEMHMFCDFVFTKFTSLSQTLNLPEGYTATIMWNLAALLMPAYGKSDPTQVQMVMGNAASGLAWLKRTNARPQQEQQFDPALLMGRKKDAGWIMHGGFL